jgi:uncharacterized peroxidase-related enzyme
MAWIRVVGEDEANDELRAALDAVVGSRGKLSNILAVHSLHPKAMIAHMDLYMAIMFGPSGLSREEREMIAVVVSAADQCPYCILHHGKALNHYWKDEDRLARFIDDPRSIDVSPKMRTILDYAVQLTERPAGVEEHDIEQLREVGLTDEEILSLNLIVSYFNFVNRIAMGLGVEFSEEEVSGYKY